MKIAVVGGTGDQGMGLARRWGRAGFEVIIGSRVEERAKATASELNDAGNGSGVHFEGATNGDAAARSEIVVITVPFAAQAATMKDIKARLNQGSLLVDVTVPLETAVDGKPTRVLGVWAGSAAEQCAELVPPGVEVVSAFHSVPASMLSDLSHEVACDVLVCGDRKEAKERLRPLVEAIPGCRYVDAGPLANSRTVEALTALLIGVNIRYKTHSGLRITGV
jgi:8-hydroxy-5-deazaflavin:NADPH oxidoreductase